MDAKHITETLEALKKEQRKFKQSCDLIVALKDLNLKNPDEQVEFYTQLPKGVGKKRKICALVAGEMAEEAKEVFDTVVTQDEFQKLEKKQIKKLADQNEFFVGQANIMPKIAATFGRFLGPRGKMPNPKAGGIVPPKAPLQPLYDKFQNTVKLSAKKSPNLQVLAGTQEMATKDLVDNIMYLYDQIIHHLPKEKNNVKHVYIKFTMSKPVKLQ